MNKRIQQSNARSIVEVLEEEVVATAAEEVPSAELKMVIRPGSGNCRGL